MASTSLQLCQKCSSYLRSKSVCMAFYHTNGAFRNSVSISVGKRKIPLQPLHHSWKLGMLNFCDFGTQAKPGVPTELAGNDMSQCNNSLSIQLVEGVATDNQTAVDLDASHVPSPFDEITDEEAVQINVPPALPPESFSLRDYVSHSETLSKLVQLGVNLWKLEQRPNVGSMLLRLDFQADVVPRLLYLKDLGVEDSSVGDIITKNPFFLTESLENLEARVSYLKSKKFSVESVASMVSRAPYLLNFSVKRLDNRLGFFQQKLGLNPQKTRDVVTRLPRLLCGSLEPVKENLQVCKLEFGFKDNEIQHIVTRIPKVLTSNKKKLTQIFDYVHNTMGIPHQLIVKFPQVLNTKFLRLKERHLFLQNLHKAQYDPSQPNYISLDRLVELPDEVFCTELALASLEDFELFQKTL